MPWQRATTTDVANLWAIQSAHSDPSGYKPEVVLAPQGPNAGPESTLVVDVMKFPWIWEHHLNEGLVILRGKSLYRARNEAGDLLICLE